MRHGDRQGVGVGATANGTEGPTLLALLDAVAVPVIAAAGIATARGVAAVLAAGADGARVSTRFIAAAESDAHPAWIEAVIAADATDAVVSSVFNAGLPEPGPIACCAGRSKPPRHSPTPTPASSASRASSSRFRATAPNHRHANRRARSRPCRSSLASP